MSAESQLVVLACADVDDETLHRLVNLRGDEEPGSGLLEFYVVFLRVGREGHRQLWWMAPRSSSAIDANTVRLWDLAFSTLPLEESNSSRRHMDHATGSSSSPE